MNLVFQEQLEKSKTLKTPTFSRASSLTLLHPLRALRVTQDRLVHQDRLDWQDFQVQWDQSGHLDPPDHQGHHTELAIMTKMDMRCLMAGLELEAHLDHRVHLALQVYLVNQVYQVSMEIKEQKDPEDHLVYRVWMDSLDSRVKRATEE